jgi:hypothetical protein
MMKLRYSMAALALLAGLTAPVQAQKIIGAVGAVIDVSGPGDPGGSIVDTFNQNGLSVTYVSGVTDFDPYIAGSPSHTIIYSGFEWFGNSGTTTAVVTYDLGSVFTIDRLALWNEEFSGIGLLDVLGSVDGVTFGLLGVGFTPTNNPPVGDYLADVFALSATAVRYVRLDMSECPQPGGGGYVSCSIGEVAFRTVSGAVPEPATWAMLVSGFAIAGCAMRTRTRKVQFA